jgi:hypothetical protein
MCKTVPNHWFYINYKKKAGISNYNCKSVNNGTIRRVIIYIITFTVQTIKANLKYVCTKYKCVHWRLKDFFIAIVYSLCLFKYVHIYEAFNNYTGEWLTKYLEYYVYKVTGSWTNDLEQKVLPMKLMSYLFCIRGNILYWSLTIHTSSL